MKRKEQSSTSVRKAVLTADRPPAHKIDVSGIPKSLKMIPRWVCWAWKRNGHKWTKIPKNARQPHKNASVKDPSTWSDFATAVQAAQKHKLGIGFVFDGGGLVGIDLDDCRDPDTGNLFGWAQDIVDHLATYTEVSPSQTGVKLFALGELPERFEKKFERPDGDGAVEVFRTGRFFTVTGLMVDGTPDDVCDRSAQLTALMTMLAGWKINKPEGSVTSEKLSGVAIQKSPNAVSADEVRATVLAALAVLDPNANYNEWIAIGMALHSIDVSLLSEWERWSAGSDKYVQAECVSKWKSFSNDHNGVGIGTLCHLADQTGRTWRPAKPSSDTFDTSPTEGKRENTNPHEWDDPQFLPDDLPDVMPFDESMLPDVFRDRVFDIANRMCCPPDFSAVSIVVAAAAVIGRKITIRPKRNDDWTVVPNLWGCVVGRPGLMKTSAIQQALHASKVLAREASEAHKKLANEYQANNELAKMKAKKIRREVHDALGGEVSDEALKQQLIEARTTEESNGPPLRRYIVMDGTYEAVADMLTESPNGFLQYRDELAGWWASLSREGQENARSFWLECWNGDGDYYIDRIGRGRVYVPSNTVSVLGATQPGKLRSYLQGAIRGDSSDDGMIQRHQMLVWPEISTEWIKVDDWPDNQAKLQVLEVFRRLDQIDPFAIGATQDDQNDFPYLRFTTEAQDVFDEWLGILERQLRSDRDPPHLESHFSKYRSLIPSLALIFHLVDGGKPTFRHHGMK